MATKRMLIDAAHPEETRVVVIDGNRLEDYDVEVASRRQLKGNIYLAKVTRVEPSLQAAFVDYGGNRHGFLAFNEIHPDYYQIPVADRERLLAEQAAAERAENASPEDGIDVDAAAEAVADEDDEIERRRARPPSRYYKIQEVIKRRQIMLVQVAKEERGNKGAALTTYLSLAGRYCVLMPNTSRGGGISRKISGVNDRKRLKKILTELEVPDGMAVIVRTAGAGRSKAEIKRDYEYLMRLWGSIRETTLESTAPALVYEEASLIKRSIRDLYDRDIEEIIVQGDNEYRIAKEFMKLFITSHAKRVKLYEDTDKPLFQKFGLEDYLDAMLQPVVQLRSGGYIVLNPTEALVAVDVNSGRATRERNIEETALRTNLEAADEIARQLRLRDLAGLIVVDFIDMENPRNQAQVERRLKEAMKSDRARVQLGRISPFGLLELSRQRLRPSLIETSFEICPACSGVGLRPTTESTALAILRKLEEEGIKQRASVLSICVPTAVAAYLLNQKRRSLLAIEERYGLAVSVAADDALVPPEHRIERMKPVIVRADEEAPEAAEEEAEVEQPAEAAAAEREDSARRGRRRRSRRKRRPDEELQAPGELAEDAAEQAAEDAGEDEVGVPEAVGADAEGAEISAAEESQEERSARKRRRRGKRGGRRRTRMPDSLAPEDIAAEAEDEAEPIELSEVDVDHDAAAAAQAADLRGDADDDDLDVEREEDEREAPSVAAGADLLADADDAASQPSEGPPARRRRSRSAPAPQASDSDIWTPEETFAATSVVTELPVTSAMAVVDAGSPEAAEAEDAPEVAEEAATAADEEGVEDEGGDDSTLVRVTDMAMEIEEVGGARGSLTEITMSEDAETEEEERHALGENVAVPAEPQPELVLAEARHTAEEDAEANGEDGPQRPRAAPDDLERVAEEARRTEIIRVGEDDAPSPGDDGNPRRGWWQRFLN